MFRLFTCSLGIVVGNEKMTERYDVWEDETPIPLLQCEIGVECRM